MYVDALDHDGLIYWYNDLVEIEKSLKSKK